MIETIIMVMGVGAFIIILNMILLKVFLSEIKAQQKRFVDKMVELMEKKDA